MARHFTAASTQYLENSSAVITAYPFTMSCWFYLDSDPGVNCFLMGVSDPTSSATPVLAFLRAQMGVAGNPLSAHQSGQPALTSNECTTGVWHHGIGLFASATDRTSILDGDTANKGTNTTSQSFTGMSITDIGLLRWNSTTYHPMDGRIAEAAVWNVSLTEAEALILAAGYRPPLVRPQSLVAYWPLIGRTSPEIDIVGGFDMTLNNTPTTAAHPPVIYGGLAQQFFSGAAAAAGLEGPLIGGSLIRGGTLQRRLVR